MLEEATSIYFGNGWTLYQDDCTFIQPNLEPGKYSLIIADPPYGIDFQSNRVEKERRRSKIANDQRPFIWFLKDTYSLLKDDGHLLCFCRWDVQEAFRLAIEWAGLEVKGQLIWDKKVHGMGDLKGGFAPRHEVIWHAVKPDGDAVLREPRPDTVMDVMRVDWQNLRHPNQKPLNLIRRLIRATTDKGDYILSPFAGSGVDMEAALIEERMVDGIEIDEQCCEKIVKMLSGERQSLMTLDAQEEEDYE